MGSMPSDNHNSSGPFGTSFQIIPGVQSYDWGKLAKDGSLVAEFAEATKEMDFKKESDQAYAELWMGTHSTLPSKIIPPPSATQQSNTSSSEGDTTLSSYLQQYPSLLGNKVQEHFYPSKDADSNPKADLPFLFKVLSIGKALSIQAHPDKSLAKRLHAEKPKMYKDDNHKPEMAIALTDFKGFCGFRPLKEIAAFLTDVPEFKSIVEPSEELQMSLKGGKYSEEEKKRYLREIFAQLMEAEPSKVKTAVETIAHRYQASLDDGNKQGLEVDDDLARLVCQLHEQFPGDVGVFCSFVLNVLKLEKGEAMFLMANEPHAYLEGNIMECMAASDNVVRAGLTPKARDVKVLIDMLTYTDAPSQEKLMKTKAFIPGKDSENYSKYAQVAKSKSTEVSAEESSNIPTLLYDPPIEEFAVLMTTLKKGEPSELQRELQGPSILIVTSGKGTLKCYPNAKTGADQAEFKLSQAGQIFFVGADTKVHLQPAEEDLIVFRAFVEV